MHELSICSSMVGIVRIRIGEMRQIVPDTLVYCWSLVTEQSELEGAELRVERVPAKIRCSGCGNEQVLDNLAFACATCSGSAVDLVEGDEFLITSLDLAGV